MRKGFKLSEIKRKKLGRFRKLLIRIGKRLFWWRFSKGNKLLLNSAYIGFYNLYYKIIKDKKEADEQWFLVGNKAGIKLMSEFSSLIEMMVSKSVKDLVHFIDTSWLLEMGKNPTSIRYMKDEKGIEKIIWTWDNCVMCTSAKNLLNPQILEKNQLGGLTAGAYKSGLETVQELVGYSYLIDVELTKSRSWGDDTCEMTATFTPIKR